jgi:O-antigen/teichoic acid export membrane protein
MASARRSTCELIVGSGVASLLTILYVAITGRLIGATEYGDFAAALAFLYLVGGALSPVVPTVAHFAAWHVEAGKPAAVFALRLRLWQIALRAVFVLAILGALATGYAAGRLDVRSLWIAGFTGAAVVLYVLLTIERAVLQGTMQYRGLAANLLLEAVFRLGGIVLVEMAPTATTAMGMYAGSLLLALAVSRIQLRVSSSGPEAPVDWRSLARFAAPNFILMLNLALQLNADVIAVRRWFDASEAGAYGAAIALARGIGLIAIPFAAAAVPALTVLKVRRQPAKRTILGFSAGFSALAAAAVAVLAFGATPLLHLLYGRDFTAAAGFLGWVAASAFLAWLGYLLAQSLITTYRFAFLPLYSAITLLQLAGYAVFHGSIREIITVQLASNLAIVIVLAVTAATMKECSGDTSTTSTLQPTR